jgi:hypothetical protein
MMLELPSMTDGHASLVPDLRRGSSTEHSVKGILVQVGQPSSIAT